MTAVLAPRARFPSMSAVPAPKATSANTKSAAPTRSASVRRRWKPSVAFTYVRCWESSTTPWVIAVQFGHGTPWGVSSGRSVQLTNSGRPPAGPAVARSAPNSAPTMRTIAPGCAPSVLLIPNDQPCTSSAVLPMKTLTAAPPPGLSRKWGTIHKPKRASGLPSAAIRVIATTQSAGNTAHRIGSSFQRGAHPPPVRRPRRLDPRSFLAPPPPGSISRAYVDRSRKHARTNPTPLT